MEGEFSSCVYDVTDESMLREEPFGLVDGRDGLVSRAGQKAIMNQHYKFVAENVGWRIFIRVGD